MGIQCSVSSSMRTNGRLASQWYQGRVASLRVSIATSGPLQAGGLLERDMKVVHRCPAVTAFNCHGSVKGPWKRLYPYDAIHLHGDHCEEIHSGLYHYRANQR